MFGVHEISNTNEKTVKRKRTELLLHAQGFTAAKSEAVKDTTAHPQITSGQLGVSSFSLCINPSEPGTVSLFLVPCSLPRGLTYTMRLKTEKFDIFIIISKHMDRKQKFSSKKFSHRFFA